MENLGVLLDPGPVCSKKKLYIIYLRGWGDWSLSRLTPPMSPHTLSSKILSWHFSKPYLTSVNELRWALHPNSKTLAPETLSSFTRLRRWHRGQLRCLQLRWGPFVVSASDVAASHVVFSSDKIVNHSIWRWWWKKMHKSLTKLMAMSGDWSQAPEFLANLYILNLNENISTIP
jgi:hypothetical protein